MSESNDDTEDSKKQKELEENKEEIKSDEKKELEGNKQEKELEENKEKEELEGETEDKKLEESNDEIKLSTPGLDPRFPNANQTARCFTAYTDYHRCVGLLGDGEEANYFKRVFTSLCPNDWITKWDEQREAGTFPGRIDRVRLSPKEKSDVDSKREEENNEDRAET